MYCVFIKRFIARTCNGVFAVLYFHKTSVVVDSYLLCYIFLLCNTIAKHLLHYDESVCLSHYPPDSQDELNWVADYILRWFACTEMVTTAILPNQEKCH